jgi:hypothetical protein
VGRASGAVVGLGNVIVNVLWMRLRGSDRCRVTKGIKQTDTALYCIQQCANDARSDAEDGARS